MSLLRNFSGRRAAIRAAAFVSFALAACANRQPFVWADEVVAQVEDTRPDYRIGRRDVINVRVWGHDGISGRVRVREDGRVSLPFIRDVDVDGMTPNELSTYLQTAFEKYVVDPVVVVTLEERAMLNVSVLGEVSKPGALSVPSGTNVLQALAAAGGLTEYASDEGIYVLRVLGASGASVPTRIRFRYDDLTGASHVAAFHLRDGDVVLVE